MFGHRTTIIKHRILKHHIPELRNYVYYIYYYNYTNNNDNNNNNNSNNSNNTSNNTSNNNNNNNNNRNTSNNIMTLWGDWRNRVGILRNRTPYVTRVCQYREAKNKPLLNPPLWTPDSKLRPVIGFFEPREFDEASNRIPPNLSIVAFAIRNQPRASSLMSHRGSPCSSDI